MEVDTRYQKFPEKPENPGFCWGKTELQFEKNMYIIVQRIERKGKKTRLHCTETVIGSAQFGETEPLSSNRSVCS